MPHERIEGGTSDGGQALIPAEPKLRGIAKEYGLGAVVFNPGLVGTKTVAQLVTVPGTPPVIELRPGSDWLTRIFAVLHECGHKVRDDTMADDRDYRLAKFAIRLYHQYRDAGNPAIQGFQELYEEEEQVVNDWAWSEFIRLFGPRYARIEDFERQGFVFQHREP